MNTTVMPKKGGGSFFDAMSAKVGGCFAVLFVYKESVCYILLAWLCMPNVIHTFFGDNNDGKTDF